MNRENGRASLHPPLHDRHLKKKDKGGIKARATVVRGQLPRAPLFPYFLALIKARTGKKSEKQNMYIKKINCLCL